MIERSLRHFSTTIDFREFLFHLAITAMLCFVVGMLYVVIADRPRKALRMARLFPMLGLTMALATTVLGSSLAIAIGLVGAMSVVRYRSGIRDMEQITFLLLVITVGLACGAGQLMSMVLALPAVAAFLLIRRAIRRRRGHLFLQLSGRTADLQALLPQLQKEFPGLRLRHARLQGTAGEWRFCLPQAAPGDFLALQNRLSGMNGLRISLQEDQDAG